MARGYKTGGRVKGTKNKADKIRHQFFSALEDLGGKEFIIDAARKEPAAFLRIISNLLPKELEADLRGGITIKWE